MDITVYLDRISRSINTLTKLCLEESVEGVEETSRSL
jgi:hypothetical protein